MKVQIKSTNYLDNDFPASILEVQPYFLGNFIERKKY